MDLNKSISLVEVLVILSPFVLTVVYALIRMHIKLNDLLLDFIDLKKENKELRLLISEKNDKIYQKIENMEGKMSLQNEKLIEIFTILQMTKISKTNEKGN